MAIKPMRETALRLRDAIENLTVEDVLKEQTENPEVLVVDLREIQELLNEGAIPGAKHVPRGMLEFWADPSSEYYRDFFGEDRRTIVYCAGGIRSVLATKTLTEMGYTNVAHLETGFRGWKESGQPIDDVASRSKWIRRPAGQ
jgi:rhodanese-related sulfurtransferase